MIKQALDEAPAGPLRVISLCAGQGRDLIEVLAEHPRRGDVRARLVEVAGSDREDILRGVGIGLPQLGLQGFNDVVIRTHAQEPVAQTT